MLYMVFNKCFAGAQPEFFQGRGFFMKLGHFDEHFVKNTWKKSHAGKDSRDFSPRYT